MFTQANCLVYKKDKQTKTYTHKNRTALMSRHKSCLQTKTNTHKMLLSQIRKPQDKFVNCMSVMIDLFENTLRV